MERSAYWRVIAPARVNLLGEHVDYNGGPVLPAAIDRYLRVEASLAGDGAVHLCARDLGESTCFLPASLADRRDINGGPLPSWVMYPAGVGWSLAELGLQVAGIKASFASDIPIGAGLSSSAALEAAFALLWQAAGQWQLDRMELAQVCLRAEREYVGLSCGILDQFAVLHGKAGHAMLLETASLSWRHVPMPAQAAIVISDLGQRRSLTGSSYNQRAMECETALVLLRENMPALQHLAEINPETLPGLKALLSPLLFRRVRHVVEESARTRYGATLLAQGNLPEFGKLMYASHESLKTLYQVSTPLLDEMVMLAKAQPGCYGSRLTGAGFGGCTVSLVDRDQTSAFCQTMADAGFSPLACRPADGARVEQGLNTGYCSEAAPNNR